MWLLDGDIIRDTAFLMTVSFEHFLTFLQLADVRNESETYITKSMYKNEAESMKTLDFELSNVDNVI